MSGVSREVATHTLNIKSGSKPVKQGVRCFDEEKHKALGEGLEKLFIQ
jgi:hypothetical protein